MLLLPVKNKLWRNRMKPGYPHKERRHHDQVIFIERRKGKIWMYGEILLLAGLLMYVVWRLI